MDIGYKLFTLRKNLGLTQGELGKKVGVSEAAIRSYETGKRKPKEKHLEKIAKALDVRMEALTDYGALTGNQVIHFLLRLEDDVNKIRPVEVNGRIYLEFDNPTLREGVREWMEHKKAFESGEISKAAYEEWKDRYYLGIHVDIVDGVVVNTDTKCHRRSSLDE